MSIPDKHRRADDPRPGDEILPSRYRKKPVEIQAIRWSGHNLRQIIDFTGLHPSADKWTWDEYEAVVREKGLKIFSLEGSNFIVTKGDYIIRGVKGEFYACKPDIFAMTYEHCLNGPEVVATPSSTQSPAAWIESGTFKAWADGDAQDGYGRAWRYKKHNGLTPVYLSPSSAINTPSFGPFVERIKKAIKEALEERLQQQHEYEKDARKWEAEGDMYGWNFHMGMAAGGNGLMHCFYRVLREVEAIEKEIAALSPPPETKDIK